MSNLVLHCGARHVQRRVVEKATTPAASESWVPIAHHRLLDLVESTLSDSGMSVANMRGQQDERIQTYKETELSDPVAHDLVIRAVDANVLPVTQVPAVLGEWRRPSHEEFSVDGKTLWRFHNAMTEVWKGRNLAALPRRSQALHGLLDSVCGLAV